MKVLKHIWYHFLNNPSLPLFGSTKDIIGIGAMSCKNASLILLIPISIQNETSNKQTITTYQLEENNGSQTCASRIIGINIINRYHKQINTMPKIIDEVGNDKNGIGYAFNQYYSRMHINDNTKSIKVNGKNLADQDYPLQYDVYIFYNEETKNETLKAMVNYLKTNEGKSLIEELL